MVNNIIVNGITNYRTQLLTNKSDISVKKYFAKFVELGLLEVEGKNKGRKYKINKKTMNFQKK